MRPSSRLDQPEPGVDVVGGHDARSIIGAATMAASSKRSVPRHGLSRVEAAQYLGISPSKFDELRHSGQIGLAKIIGSRLLFDVYLLDEFFRQPPDREQ